jgi:para-nitrobenzyl esterase
MSWHLRRTTLFAMLACGVLSAACDDDLGFGDHGDEHDDSDAHSHTTTTIGGGGTAPGRGGGTVVVIDDHDHDVDHDSTDNTDDGIVVAVPDDTDRPRVTIDQGTLEGRWADTKVRRFLGVPYAAPPTGDRRWAAPQDPGGWSKVRDAGSYSKRCAQLSSSAYDSDASDDEDCLYLNVWAPSNAPKRGLPVVFWIHGGDHTYGSASELVPSSKTDAYYDGTALANRGVVVVTINYRVGALGFFAHPVLDTDGSPYGNQGLWDQQYALQWVKYNIADFGGDPSNVTIFGQGSGASDVCMHVVAPTSQNLFSQAISESGSCTLYQPTANDVASASDQFVSKLGCSSGTASSKLKCLRSKSAKDVLAAAPASGSPFTAIVDGYFLADQPRYLYADANFAPVPYIIGSNSYEGLWYSPDYASVKTEADYHAFLQKRFPGVSLEELCEVYPHDEFGDSASGYQRSLARVFGDAYVTCAVTDTAVRAQAGGSPVYLYNFDATPDAEGLGPSYGGELGYVFGTSKLNSDQRNVSNLVQTYWTNLAGYGDPTDNNSDVLAWPKFTAKNNQRMDFAVDTAVVNNLYSNECALWNKVYDQDFADLK